MKVVGWGWLRSERYRNAALERKAPASDAADPLWRTESARFTVD